LLYLRSGWRELHREGKKVSKEEDPLIFYNFTSDFELKIETQYVKTFLLNLWRRA